MAYAGATPWHGHGTQLAEDASFEVMLEASGLDWRNELRALYLDNNGGRLVQAQGVRMATRSDTGEQLGPVGDDYTPWHNADVLGWLASLVQDREATFHTAGSLFGGRLVFATLRMGEDWTVADDVHTSYIVASASHDGSRVAAAQATDVRVVCNNTLNMALGRTSGQRSKIGATATGFRYRHTSGLPGRLAQAREFLAVATAEQRAMRDWLVQLAAERAESALTEAIIAELFPDPADNATARVKGQHGEAIATFRTRFLTPEVMRSGPTAYALLNAATGYADHGLTYRAPEGSAATYRDDSRFTSTLLGGRAAQLKAQAVAVLCEVVPA
jgi:phage/plasmid-like protein (TIGR03299 family)